jgi:4-amino-4-deoxy-L-arabinose transferase-like glycosyltransferase
MRETEHSVAEPRVKPEQGRKGLGTWRHRILTLSLIVAASFAVRVVALKTWGTGAINSDGAEYVTIAENLRKGVGYVGIVTPGLELNTPPLLPLLISGASFVTGSYVQAGRLVSLLLGVLLPLPVFCIALRMFNRRIAFVAAALAILHPLLINLSFTVLSEGPYATLLLTAVYLVLCALDRPSTRMWCGVGGAFGLAYLVRPETVAPFLIALMFAFAATKGALAIKCKRAIAAIAMFAALSLPWVILVYRATGKIRLDGKSTIVFALDTRILSARANSDADHRSLGEQNDEPSSLPNLESWQPWQEKWASAAINTNLEGTGIWMRPNAEVVRQTHITVKELVQIIGKAMRKNAPAFLQQLSSKWLGAPLLPALALLGVLRRPWRRPLASSRLFVLLVPATAVVATFFALWTFPRFYFVLVPFLLIWAANGLVEFGLWMRASGAAAGWRWLGPGVSKYIIPGLIGLGAMIYPLKGVRALYEFSEGSPHSQMVEEVGLWIGQQQDHPITIMATIPLAYYAEARFVAFPYCSGELALRFLDAARVDYIVLRRSEKFTQYYEDWLMHGIPDSRAELVNVSSDADPGEFMVYRWHRADVDPLDSSKSDTKRRSTKSRTLEKDAR